MDWRDHHPSRSGPKPSSGSPTLRAAARIACVIVLVVGSVAASTPEPDLSHESPATRRLRASMQGRVDELSIYMQQGQVGIDKDGHLVMRSQAGVPERIGESIARQVQAENADRTALVDAYREANGLPMAKRDAIIQALAKRWRAQAPAGAWIQNDDGRWVAK